MDPIRSILALQLLVFFLTIISFNVVEPKHPSPPPAPVPAIPGPPTPVPPALPPTIITPSPPPPPCLVVSTIIKPSPPQAPVPAIPAPPTPVPPALPPTIITPSPPPPPCLVVSTIIKPSPPPPPPFSVPPIGKLLISVEGVVYCQYCKFPGYDKVLNASPLRGALAKLVCYNKEKGGEVVTTKTDRKGYFLIQSYKLSGFQARSCKVVVTSPLKVCSKLVHPGLPLRFERVVNMGKTQVALFTAGFFEFAPPYGTKCNL